jgi:hypothetical protein
MSAKAPELVTVAIPDRAVSQPRWAPATEGRPRAGAKRSGYSGVLGDDCPGNIKAAGGRASRAIADGGNHPRDAGRDDIRQRKRLRFLFRHLRFRGASIKAAAGAAFSGRGRLFCANHPGADLPAWFSEKLVSLATPGTGSVDRLVAGRG